MFRIKSLLLALFLTIVLFSCKKDVPPVVVKPGIPMLVIVFEPTVNSEALVPDKKWYTNFSNDSFTVSKFSYYISNIKFKRADGSVYSVPNSYHLIQHVERKNTILLGNLPEGDFSEIEFLIGVDSIRNVSGAQSGALDPANNMFWDWITGYVFFKLEGKFNTLSQPGKEDYAIHIGGFEGKDNSIQSCSFPLSTTLQFRNDKTCNLYFKVKLEEVFQNPVNIDFDYYYATLPSNNSKEISTNYKDMFFPYKVEN